jgi:shikimate kinase
VVAADSQYLVLVSIPRLVFLYGPPAVGKLTVARAMAVRERFRILHNHLTIDPVTEILQFGTDAFWLMVGGRVFFVQLHAPREVLLQRVTEQSRREHRKITDPATLEQLLDQYENFTGIAVTNSLCIENASIAAEEVAGQILGHLASHR